MPHGDGDGIRTPPRSLEGVKNFQMTSFTMLNNVSSMKCALTFLGLRDVEVPLVDGDGPRIPHRCMEGSRIFFVK